MSYLVGIDGGGTRTTVVLAAPDGTELHRLVGPAGLVDPRDPKASADLVATLVREAAQEADVLSPAHVLCAGLAGVEHEADRTVVRHTLDAAGLAEQVVVVSDGHIAVEGALGDGPGVLLMAGTGSIGYARDAAGEVVRCGGWGLILGDEGSAYHVGRAALTAALRGFDGRDEPTALLDALLDHTGSDTPRGLPSWARRVPKAEVAALTRIVDEAARAGDTVADRLFDEAAVALAELLPPLAQHVEPHAGPIPLVFFGGMFRIDGFEARVRATVDAVLPARFVVRPARWDAVTGALRVAQALTTRPLAARAIAE
ncbi:MAG: BadF/BadG/BcrA/BcrD ATPase family protein [Bacteroidota bacterium]